MHISVVLVFSSFAFLGGLTTDGKADGWDQDIVDGG